MEKLLRDFTKRYIANRDKCSEMDSSLIEERSFDTWKEVLIERSRVMRNIYSENEDFLKRLQFELKEPVNDESAQALFDALSELYEGAYDDLFIMKNLAEPIIPFYEEKKDYDKLAYIYKLLGFEHYEFFGRILKEEGIDESVSYNEKAIALKEHYSEIKDSKNRMCIFTVPRPA